MGAYTVRGCSLRACVAASETIVKGVQELIDQRAGAAEAAPSASADVKAEKKEPATD